MKLIDNMKRTNQQNKSLHKYLDELSRELNLQGIDVKVMVKNLRVDATPEMMKEIFRSIAKEKFQVSSTADLSTKQLTECYEEMNRLTSSMGIAISFPSQENTEEYLSSFVQ